MDSQCGIEMETLECVLEKSEQPPASSSSAEKDFIPHPCTVTDYHNIGGTSNHADILKYTDTVTDSTESTMDKTVGDIHQNADSSISTSIDATNDDNTATMINRSVDNAFEKSDEAGSGRSIAEEIADDKLFDTTSSVPSIAAVSNTDATFDKSGNAECEAGNNDTIGMSMDPVTAHSESFGAAIESVSSNVDSIICSSTDGKDSFIERILEMKINEDGTRAMQNIGAEVIDGPVVNAISDASPNAKLDDASAEIITKSEESGALHNVENTFPPDHITTNSGVSGQPSKPIVSDSYYDSEVEIIDCTSENLEDQPAAGSAGPSDQSPIVDGTSLDSNTDIAANPSGSGIEDASSRNPRTKKKALYQKRCTNLRLFRMKLESGEVTRTSTGRSRVSPHCLDKLTKNNLKFMENFDPKMSNRERRKMQRKTNTRRQLRGDLYGLNGALVSSGKNLCDCMNPDCPGCHFPCPRCQSPKCGHECRVNRKWTYEEIEIDGTDIVIRPHELIESFSNNC